MLFFSSRHALKASFLFSLLFSQAARASPAPKPPKPSRCAGDHSVDSSSPLLGPVTDTVFADPSVVKVDDTYYAYATNNKAFNCPVATSPDFKTWTLLTKDTLPQVGPWAEEGKDESIWAPDVTQSPQGHFLMYYTALIQSTPNIHRCIGVATADTPTGPFTPQETAAICPQDATVIDPAGWISDPDSSGQSRHYVLHKVTTSTTAIVAQPMSADGLIPEGPPISLTNATESEGWNNEAPSLVYAGGNYVLFYSTHYWKSLAYTVSVATAPNLKGPWTRRDTPLIETGTGEKWGLGAGMPVAPGGADVLFAEDIEDLGDGSQSVRIVFHAAKSETELESRELWTALVRIKGAEVDLL